MTEPQDPAQTPEWATRTKPKRAWFAKFLWSYFPISWEGYLVILVGIALIGLTLVAAEQASSASLGFAFGFAVAIEAVAIMVVCNLNSKRWP